jgi:hypothetical protein
MVIVQIDGWLGNQMFQYALCLALRQNGAVVKPDISSYSNGYLHNGYELEKLFNLNELYSSAAERNVHKRLGKLLHLLTRHPYKEKPNWQWQYHEGVNKIKFGFLKGYWQTEKYFENAATTVQQRFTFPSVKDEKNAATVQQIRNSNAVSLHIRRGDYITNERNCSLNEDYYKQAIEIINNRISNPVFFIFSDDMEWARKNIPVQEAVYVQWNKGTNSYIDMQLMSLCQHNIIANSSFSWWGAWLNRHTDKMVIAPQQWMPHLTKNTAVVPQHWIQVPNRF